jgi:hypothetical protein
LNATYTVLKLYWIWEVKMHIIKKKYYRIWLEV